MQIGSLFLQQRFIRQIIFIKQRIFSSHTMSYCPGLSGMQFKQLIVLIKTSELELYCYSEKIIFFPKFIFYFNILTHKINLILITILLTITKQSSTFNRKLLSVLRNSKRLKDFLYLRIPLSLCLFLFVFYVYLMNDANI